MEKNNLEPEGLTICRIAEDDWEEYRKVRLNSLQDSPLWFGATWEDARARTDESWKKQVLQLATSPVDCSFLASSNGRSVGIMSMYQVEKGTGELMQVWVSSQLRGSRVAEQLFAKILDWARQAQFQRLVLKVKPDNTRAIQFYKKLGFAFVENVGEESLYSLSLDRG